MPEVVVETTVSGARIVEPNGAVDSSTETVNAAAGKGTGCWPRRTPDPVKFIPLPVRHF